VQEIARPRLPPRKSRQRSDSCKCVSAASFRHRMKERFRIASAIWSHIPSARQSAHAATRTGPSNAVGRYVLALGNHLGMRQTQFSGMLSNVVACAHSTCTAPFCAITAIIARRTCMTRSRAYTRGTEGCGHADNADCNYKEELLHRRHYTAANRRMQGNFRAL